MAEIKVWARLGAYVTVPAGTNLSDLNEIDFDELYACGKLRFDGDSYVPEESELDAVDVVEVEEKFSIDSLSLDDESQRAMTNVLQSIKNISSYVSYARCDESVKQNIAEMGERFLRAVENKLSKEFRR